MMGPNPISAKKTSLAKVLLLANDLASAHAVREGIRRAGLSLVLETVGSRAEFVSRLRSGPVDLLLAATSGLGEMSVPEILEHAESLGVALVLIGEENEGSGAMRARVSDYVGVTQLARLPTIIERTLRDRRQSDRDERGRLELERAADLLRENQKLLTLGRLAASIAHEINNPLEAVTNLLYLMEIEHGSPEKCAEYLKMAQGELNRVVQISKQTLTFSRETSTPVRLQLADLIEEVLVLYGRKIADKNLRVIRQYESSEAVLAFPGEMRQVLSNLITNAIEATEGNGKLLFRIRNAHKWPDEGIRGLRVSVADTGSGIAPEARIRLGEPFFTTKGQSGTGLGLWVTRSILNRYGGSLRFRSSTCEDRHGSVFTLFMPTDRRPLMVMQGGNASSTASTRPKPPPASDIRSREAERSEQDRSKQDRSKQDRPKNDRLLAGISRRR